MKAKRKFIKILDSDYEIIKETKKGVLIKRGENQAWIMKRWINKNRELTKSAEKALIEASFKRKIANAGMRKIDISQAKRETEKAYLFTATDWSPDTGTVYYDFWVAKSQIKNGAVPEWIFDDFLKKFSEKEWLAGYSQNEITNKAIALETSGGPFSFKYLKSPFGALTNDSEEKIKNLEKQLERELEAVENKSKKSKSKAPKSYEMPKPNAKIERDYRLALMKNTTKMNQSFRWWLGASLKKENPLTKVKSEFRELAKHWETKFSDFSKSEAVKFIYKILKHSDSVLNTKNADIFKIKQKSKLINSTIKARINENIALIKSIPREQILRYESVIYQNITNLDRQNLTQELSKIFKKMEVSDKIAKNRVKTIARDQTKKATETLSQARAQANGFKYYMWITANDERVSTGKGGHKYLNGRIYKYGEDTAIIDSYGNIGTCGERVNCRCTSGAVYLMPNEELERVSDPEHGDYYKIVEKSAEE